MAGAALGAPSQRSAEVRRRVMRLGAASFCVAAAAIGAPQVRFAWHAFGRRFVLRGKCSARSTSGSFFVACAAVAAPSQRSAQVRRRVMCLGAASFCVAGAALGAPQVGFAWQAQNLEHVRRVCVAGAALGAPQVGFAWQAQHLEPFHRGPRKTGHHQTHHHQHNTISHIIFNTTSSTQPHQHITIYITPSTQHHLHNTMHTTPSTLHHQTLAGAALGALPSYPFCLIPGDTPFVILCCGLFFVLFR